jgi:hypothetical protein
MSQWLKILLWVGFLICALVSLWLAMGIFGMWFIGPAPDPSMTRSQDILQRLGITGLFLGLSLIFGTLSRLALRKVRGIRR